MIYFLQRSDGAIKIGTTKHYHLRVSGLRSKHGDLTLLGFTEGSYPEESELHQRFSDSRIHPRHEWFRPSPEILQFIEQHTQHVVPQTGKTMTVRISDRTKIALDLFAAKQTLKTGDNLTNDETIVRLLEDTDPELIKEAERIERERDDDETAK